MSITDRPQGRTAIVTKQWRIALVVCLGVLLLAVFPSIALAQNGLNMYTVHSLVSDLASLAPVVDPNLVNGWGIAAGPTTPWWVSDNGSDKSTLYNGAGTPQALVVDVAGAPTGVVFNVFNASMPTAFLVNGGPSRFLFATESGTILGWRPGFTAASAVADRSGAGAVYKGLAIGSAGHGNANSGSATTLYFAAGPDDESHGLFGSVTMP